MIRIPSVFMYSPNFQSCAWWLYCPGSLSQVGFGFGTFFRVGNLVLLLLQFMMATFNRGQSPARHTKVMDSYPGPLKKDRPPKK